MAEADRPPLPDQAQRERILNDLDTTMLVEAAAGTGKTTSMVGRMIALVGEGRCGVGTLAAVTFTRKAAAELRARFQVKLEAAARQASGKARERLAEAARRVEQCFIGTIHSFCGRLLRERPVEAGVDVAFREIDEVEDARLRQQAWDHYVTALLADDHPILGELDELGLDIGQLARAFHRFADFPDVHDWPTPEAPLPDVEPAADQLRDYARHMEDLVPSFPDERGSDKLMGKYEQVARQARYADLGRIPDLFRILGLFGSHGATLKCWPSKDLARAERDRWTEFAESVAQPFLRAVLAARYEPCLRAIRPAVAVCDRLRADAGALNFQDLLLTAAALLRDKPHVRAYFRKRFTHLLVDEFQDTDPIQAEVMLLLTADDATETGWRACRPVAGSLFVVGDPKQSIYRFRRADIVTYNQVKAIVQDTGGAVLELSTNFRSTRAVVDFVNGAFAPAFPEQATCHSPAYVPLDVGRRDGCEGELAGIRRLGVPADCCKTADAAEFEADLIARAIRDALDRGLTVPRTEDEVAAGKMSEADPGDFMIVTRNTTRLSVYARKLQDLGIAHQVTGGTALNEVAELKLLHTALTAVVQPHNPVALVAALRGPLFGISDEHLYDFRRAGGRFHFRGAAPGSLDDGVRELFVDAFERLRAYAEWLTRLPPVAAIERIATHIGLPLLACSGPGGDVRAGSFAKAIELLRAAHRDLWSAAELVDYLGQLVEQEEKHDGIPARPRGSAVVRVMNLHKVKGLEAPVVFLADPSGAKEWPPTLHVDRSGRRTVGHMTIRGEADTYGNRDVLAQPLGWEGLADDEQAFERAETTRLLYVAATRAGAQLVIAQKAKGNRTNPWRFFQPFLDGAATLDDPGEKPTPAGGKSTLTVPAVQQARARIRGRWQQTARATYDVSAVKRLALADDPRPLHAGEHGIEWGTLVHALLNAAMTAPGADLANLAAATIDTMEIEPAFAAPAIETVRSVMASDLWRRAQNAERALSEVPFQLSLRPDDPILVDTDASASVPTLLRGVIDLAFLEPGGWVVVDYKTDRISAARPIESLIDHYLPQVRTYAAIWERITDESVKERGLYFTSTHEYRTAPPA